MKSTNSAQYKRHLAELAAGKSSREAGKRGKNAEQEIWSEGHTLLSQMLFLPWLIERVHC